jgi:uncharacterized protein (TIGR03435 family)
MWQSTVFAVALLSLAFRRNRARLRHGLWFGASVKFLVPFAALATVVQAPLMNVAVMVSLIVPFATGAIGAAAVAPGQLPGSAPIGPPVDPETRFEVVSIKPFDASGGATPRISMPPGRYDHVGMPLWLLFMQALRVPADRIIGLPDWVDTQRYTIAAKAPDGPPPSAMAMTVMMANLLKDRFKMVTHTETREMPVYNLVFARSDKRFGPSLKETSAECKAAIAARIEAARRGPVPAAPAGSSGCGSSLINPGIASFSGIQMAQITQFLTQSVGRPVIDKTGLTGYYDYALKWTPQPGSGMPSPFGLPTRGLPGGPPAEPPPAADLDGPNLFTAVQEQLGLKLESGRGPVEAVVIDRLEKPTLD